MVCLHLSDGDQSGAITGYSIWRSPNGFDNWVQIATVSVTSNVYPPPSVQPDTDLCQDFINPPDWPSNYTVFPLTVTPGSTNFLNVFAMDASGTDPAGAGVTVIAYTLATRGG
ncbi:MAG TPA: hypothetical protein VFC51_14215 [Chloroflexota bacterium]|nr:hypothetical protein [Chloroflexota bacterium]